MDVNTSQSLVFSSLCEKLEAKRVGVEWVARCPAHNDKTPSLHLTTKDETILWHCKAGCTQEAVREALGISSPISNEAHPSLPPGIRPTWKEHGKREKRLVKYWKYLDSDGQTLGYTARYEDSDDKAIIPYFTRTSANAWRAGLDKSSKKSLYGLYSLVSNPKARVVIVEGEKCVDAIMDYSSSHSDLIGISWIGGCNNLSNVRESIHT